MSAGITFKVGVTSKKRTQDTFRPTITYTETWISNSNLDSYHADLTSLANSVYSYILQERNDLNEVGIHYSATLENITAAIPSKGSWVQAKQHFDGALTDEETTSASFISDKLASIVSLLKKQAHY